MRTIPRPLRAGALATSVASAMLLTACAAPGEADTEATSDPPSASEAPDDADATDNTDATATDNTDATATDAEDAGSSDPAADVSDGSQHSEEQHDGDTETDPAPTTQLEADGAPVIEIDMLEFAYDPSSLELQAGEAAILRFTNHGEAEHEAMLGDAHMQEEFAASDDHGDHGSDGGDGHHGDTMAVTLAPGETTDLEVVIDEPGTWYLGCHLPGHYDAGMEATVTVVE